MDRDEEAEAGLDELAEEPASSSRLAAQARQAGDDAVEALAKVTAGMANGEQRSEQQEMCRAVGEAIVTGTHLVVQAGTGTGKSLAYLVPAVLSGKKVVVATATKALQDQLAEKDLPLVDRGLGLTFSGAVLKGRSNYICRQRVDEVGNGGIQPEFECRCRGRDRARRARRIRREHRDRSRRRSSRPGGRGAHVVGLVRDDPDRRPGRSDLRAQPSRLEHGQCWPPRVPRSVQLPFGESLFRRSRPRCRRGGGRGRRQYPPLRCPPGQRPGGAARPRRGHLRRDARTGGGDDGVLGRRDHPGPLPSPGPVGVFPGHRKRSQPAFLAAHVGRPDR